MVTDWRLSPRHSTQPAQQNTYLIQSFDIFLLSVLNLFCSIPQFHTIRSADLRYALLWKAGLVSSRIGQKGTSLKPKTTFLRLRSTFAKERPRTGQSRGKALSVTSTVSPRKQGGSVTQPVDFSIEYSFSEYCL